MQRLEYELSLDALVRLTGAGFDEIAHYAAERLLPEKESSRGRMFRPNAVEVVVFIRECLRMEFSIEETRMMITLAELFVGGGEYAGHMVKRKRRRIKSLIARLKGLEEDLEQFELRCRTESCLAALASQPSRRLSAGGQ